GLVGVEGVPALGVVPVEELLAHPQQSVADDDAAAGARSEGLLGGVLGAQPGDPAQRVYPGELGPHVVGGGAQMDREAEPVRGGGEELLPDRLEVVPAAHAQLLSSWSRREAVRGRWPAQRPAEDRIESQNYP